MCLKESCFPDYGKVSSVNHVFNNVGGYLRIVLSVFFLWLVKSFKNLKINGLLATSRNVAFFLISSMFLGLLNQLEFW